MLFNSIHFAVFFVVVFTLMALLRNRVRQRNVVLLAASYYFYSWWDWRFLGLLILTTLFDYTCGRLLRVEGLPPGTHPQRTKHDRIILGCSMSLNLIVLGFFKYFNFFVDSAANLLNHVGFHVQPAVLSIVLPIGISFYTFQSMNYVIDVYRGELEGEKSLLNFAVFVSFFPHLVAGPILRATDMMPQIKSPNVITWEKVSTGFYLICWGLFKKVVIADNMAPIADQAFNNFTDVHGLTALVGVYAFAAQIYCDFSGYTDVARGTARCMGFELVRNFDLPYFAVNPSDFWRRWHISLSTWLRDYLYIPLGGNRKGNVRTYVNLMITMLLGGLWHGAAWTFVLWGAFHGALLCVHRALQPYLKRYIAPRSLPGRAAWTGVRVLVMFHLVCFGWLLFRAENMEQVAAMVRAVAQSRVFDFDIVTHAMLLTFVLTGGTLFLVQVAQAAWRDRYVVLRLPVPVRAVAYAAAILGILIFGNTDGRAFIYFQF